MQEFFCSSKIDWDVYVSPADIVRIVKIRGYYAEDAFGGEKVYFPDATSAEEAAQEYADPEIYDPEGEGRTVKVHVWRRAIGYTKDRRRVTGIFDWDSVIVRIPPDDYKLESRAFLEAGEDPPSNHQHHWKRPARLVGGLKCNPGVWGNPDGSITITEVCSSCGLMRRSSYRDGLLEHRVVWLREEDES
ncbi:MAG: hypothetical protein KatS3mg087_1341 [Patescibacteria group bacterium]|nr:MAG: hypothetical protein KatS3mg087_1341 [Patescibacteria group bacterium]